MYMFSFLLAAGVTLGLAWAIAGLKDKQAVWLIDASLGLLVGGLIASRMVYVGYHWAYYRVHLLEIPQVWAGGLSAIGALAGGLCVWIIYGIWKPQDFKALAGHFLPLLMLVAVAACLGSWFKGVAYGQRLNVARWGLLSLDEWGILAQRFPTQFLGAVLILGWYGFISSWKKPKMLLPGWLPGWEFFGISAIFMVLTFLRADPMPQWGGLRLDTWGGLMLTGCSAIYLYFYWSVKQK
jgi:prolipoprotein diacylglyceryltransferase